MRKYIIYSAILTVGVLLGYLLFNGNSEKEIVHSHNENAESNQMWTCSMHPQIMQKEAGICPICGMELIPAESDADGMLANQFKLTENAMALANVQTSIVGDDSTAKNEVIKLSGKIVENEESKLVQVSYFSGRIEQLYVSFTGEEVRKGQLLASVYSPELYAAQQELITAASLKESQTGLYQAVRNKLFLWKLSEAQIAKIESSGEILENFPIYATVSGTVTEKLVEQGENIKQGQAMFKISNLNTVWANFDVFENQVGLFKKGQEITITTNAYQQKEFKAKVSFIEPVLSTKTRIVKLRVVLNNTDNAFKPGMFVEGKIEGVASSTQISIPSTAILWTGERSVVYLKPNSAETIFEMQEVTLGNKIGESYLILEGLKKGDEIVTNGTFTVDAAAQLHGKKSMMNQKGETDKAIHDGHLEIVDFNKIERIKVGEKFQSQLMSIYEGYLTLKDALVNDKPKKASEGAIAILNSLIKVENNLLKDKKTASHWLKLENEIKTNANLIIAESEINTQRHYFKSLSSSFINAVETFGVDEKVYLQFCPMADDNAGAYWLSKEEKVLNPYFGKKMHTCGHVTYVID